MILYYEIHIQRGPDVFCTSRNLMIVEAIEKVCAKMPKERLIFIMDRGFANENILKCLNDLEVRYICRLRLGVTVSDEPHKKAKRLIREVVSETQEGRVSLPQRYYKGRIPITLVINRSERYCEPLALAVSPTLPLTAELPTLFLLQAHANRRDI